MKTVLTGVKLRKLTFLKSCWVTMRRSMPTSRDFTKLNSTARDSIKNLRMIQKPLRMTTRPRRRIKSQKDLNFSISAAATKWNRSQSQSLELILFPKARETRPQIKIARVCSLVYSRIRNSNSRRPRCLRKATWRRSCLEPSIGRLATLHLPLSDRHFEIISFIISLEI